MIVIDSSALVAILTGEPERGRFIDAIVASPRPLMSAFNLFETRTVLLRRSGEGPLRELQEFLDASQVEVCTFNLAQASGALDAYRRFGRGSGHKARLNLGDCAAYALARSLDLPLLFKGGDFARTDVRPALT